MLRERRKSDLGYLKTEKTRAILPIARILLRITSLRMAAASPYREHDQFGCELNTRFDSNATKMLERKNY